MALDVLVVDDSAVMRAVIIKAMRLGGLPLGEVHEAGNGQEGLRLLEEHQVDLALVDLTMPVMGGEEMIERIRQNAEIVDFPLIVISSEGSDSRVERLRTKGVPFLQKPIVPRAMWDIIADVTGVVSDEQDVGEGTPQGSGPDF